MTEPRAADDLREAAARFRRALADLAPRPMRLMEVCGTHSHVIGRLGVRDLLPPQVKLLSGPGCPVCVTAPGEIDAIIELARRPGVVLCTFGDMMRVPGSAPAGEAPSTLSQEKARGAQVQVIYSALQAVEIASERPDSEVVLVGVGFETTAPTVAAAVLEAERRRLPNFTLLALHKLVPPALAALLSAGDVQVDGLLCPGHVSTIIGADAYRPLVAKYHLPCVIAGFEATDVMAGILRLAEQVQSGRADLENVYGRAVSPAGNQRALGLMNTVFAPVAAVWRGLGAIPGSGLRLREQYQQYDAVARHAIAVAVVPEPAGCCCGAVLRGALSPDECPSFGTRCTTQTPVGPCMVSSEGSCAAQWRYGARGETAREGVRS